MRMRCIRSLAVLVLGIASMAPASVAQESVRYKSGGDEVSGLLLRPDSAGRHPALIVIHEWWGVNDWVRAKGQKFAGDGYVSLVVDLYRGNAAGDDADKAHQLMRGLPEDRAIRDLTAAFAYLASRPDVDPARIGAIGWCMGGGYALATAVAEPKLAACVVNYGRLVTDPKTIAGIHAPLLGNFGALDQGIPPDSVHAFEKEARAQGKLVDFKVYEGAGHGFASSKDPKTFRPDAAKDADARTDAFLKAKLKG